MTDALSLQERFAAACRCFGCGPANPDGLQLRSFERGELVVATWRPAARYEAYDNMLSGGIIGTLLDCHCNWTAAWALMQREGLTEPPCTVTAQYTIQLVLPTPTDRPVELQARPMHLGRRRAEIEGQLSAGGRITATCRGTFVAVQPAHPAFHRW